jgi:hypothetical protein
MADNHARGTTMIYIATDINGRGIKHVTAFEDRAEFYGYVDEVLAFNDATPKRSDSIATLCDHLYDHGVGFGARSHHRVDVREARFLVRQGANGGWLNPRWRT